MPVGTFLTPVNGDLTINVAGTIVDGKDVHGCIVVNAANVTIRNTRVSCSTGINNAIYADSAPAAANLTIDHVDLSCNKTGGNSIGIWGHGMVVTHAYIHDCVNGLEINDNSLLQDSYLVATEENSGGGHGDDIQSQEGSNVTIRHNTFAGLNPITSSIITNPTANNNWLVEDNFMSAGAYTIYCPEQGTNFTVRNNRFYPYQTRTQTPQRLYLDLGDAHAPAYGLTDACNHAGINWSGNFYDDNLSSVNSFD